ncbi:MAG: ParA family protein [Deltaproteobacteria bacterium]|nr:ParA family protein [Deltaproteobacteria bacterium]
MNTAFSAADFLIIPVDAGFFALMGIKELLAEVSEIKTATNQRLKVLGYLLTLADHTKMTEETWDGLISSFGKQVFETKIRRTVKLREAPAIGKTIFHHDPEGAGSQDYFSLAQEVLTRLTQMNYIAEKNEVNIHNSQPNQTPVLSLVSEVGHG